MADKPQKTAAAKGSNERTAPLDDESSSTSSSSSSVDLDELLANELEETDDNEERDEEESEESGEEESTLDDDEDAESEEVDDDQEDDDDDSEAESDEDEDEESDDDDSADDDSADDEEADDEESDDSDTSAAPGLEKLAKKYPWAAKRIEKQSQQIQKLKHQRTNEATAIQPTPLHPLASVEKLEDYDATLDRAKQVRRWCRENPDGGEVRVDGRVVEVTPEQVEAKLEATESLLEQAPDWKIRLMSREKEQPWKEAEAVVPDLFEEGSPANDKLKQLIKDVPELKLRLPNWEYVAAAAVRGMLQADEEKTGKVRYARISAGKEPDKSADKKTKPAQKQARKSPGTQGAKKPPSRNSRGSKSPDPAQAAERYARTQSPDDLKGVLAAELSNTF